MSGSRLSQEEINAAVIEAMPYIRRAARKLVTTRTALKIEIDDLVAETVLHIIDKAGKWYDPTKATFKTFSINVTHQVWSRRWKMEMNTHKRRGYTTTIEKYAPSDEMAPVAMPENLRSYLDEDEISARLAMENVSKYIERLSSADQEALDIMYFQDINIAEEERRRNLGRNVIRSRAFDAVRRIRRMMVADQNKAVYESAALA